MRYSRKKILAFIAHSCRLNRGFSAPPLDTPDGKCNNFIKGPDPYDGEDYVQYLQKSPSWQRTEILHLCQAGQWIGKRADDFTYFSPGYYVFNIKAKNSDPSEWKIGQNEYEKVRYDINALITLLKKSEIILKGYIELVLHEFDGYQLIHMTRTDQEGHGTILGEQSLFFRDGDPIKIGRRIKFDDVRDFYRYSK